MLSLIHISSFADLAVILLDATQGVLVQTRRPASICALMGIKYFIFAVNKMDLAKYSEDRFREIEKQIEALKAELGLENVYIVPVSATEGDNVTKASDNMKWYEGKPILSILEQVDIDAVSYTHLIKQQLVLRFGTIRTEKLISLSQVLVQAEL